MTSARRSWASIGLLVLFGLGLVAVGSQLPVWRWLQEAIAWLRSAGPGGMAVFALVHIAAIVLLVPVSPFVFAAGFVWGTFGGTALITVDNTVGTLLAFLLAQRALRPLVVERLGHHRHVRAIDRAMALGGFQAVVMLRLSPIVPMSILNYGLGLFPITRRQYVGATAVGLLPITLLYCWGAAGLGELSDVGAVQIAAGPWQQGLFWAGLAATFGAVWWLQRLAARALAEIDQQPAVTSAAADRPASA